MGKALCVGLPPRVLTVVGLVLVVALLAAPPVNGQSQTAADTLQPWHSVMYRSVLGPKCRLTADRSLSPL